MSRATPADVDHDVTSQIESFVNSFGQKLHQSIKLGDGEDMRHEILESYLDMGPDRLIEELAGDPSAVAVVFSKYVDVLHVYLVNARIALERSDDDIAELIARGSMMRGPKCMVARDNQQLDMLLFGLLRSVQGIRLYCQVALILGTAYIKADLRPYFE